MPSWLICRFLAGLRRPPTSPLQRPENSNELRSRYAGLVLEVVRPILPDRTLGYRRRLCLLAVEQAALRPGRRRDPSRRGQAMSVEERDPHSGYMTTGHEWNGIK